jgi:hypothetical protein
MKNRANVDRTRKATDGKGGELYTLPIRRTTDLPPVVRIPL